MKHSIISLVKDIKAFQNIKKNRQKHFDLASSASIREPAGVNTLAAELHPDSIRLTVASKFIYFDGTIIVTLKKRDGKLPFFKPGQYINVLCGETVSSFFLCSEPYAAEKGEYEISVETGNAAYKFFSDAKEGDELISGAPMGHFYHQPLRDGETSAVIADETGTGAALSMKNNEKTEVFFCFCGDDIPSAERINADTVFICGKKVFCDSVKAMLPGRHIRECHTDVPEKNTARQKFRCTVICGDDTFTLDCYSDEPLMTALEKNGIRLYNKCRTGDCAFCRARLAEGSVSHVFDGENDHRRKADIKYGYIHPCRAFPESDVILKY